MNGLIDAIQPGKGGLEAGIKTGNSLFEQSLKRAQAERQAEEYSRKIQDIENKKRAIIEVLENNEDIPEYIKNIARIHPETAFEIQQAERKYQQELALKDPKTTSMKDYEYFTGLTPDEQEQYLRLKKAGGTNIELTPYDKEMQKLQAEQEANIIEQQRTERKFVDVAGNLLNKLEQNKDLFTAYSPYSKKLGSLTGGSLGMTDDSRKKRGEIVSLIKTLEQKLVANARASGQVGINTLAERQAALGPLNENAEAEELIGYVKGLIDINNEIYNLGLTQQEDPLGIRR